MGMSTNSMEELNEKQLASLHKVLLELQREIHAQLDDNAGASATVELDQTLVGRVSRVDALQQQSIALNSRQQLLQRQRKILAALNSFNNDNYGYCQHCDEPIGFARLQAQPEANLCLRCQELADKP